MPDVLPLLAADEFREILRTFAQGPLEPIEIAGPVDLAGLEFERPIRLDKVVFRDEVVLSGAHFCAGLTLADCQFKRGANLTGIRVGGGLTLSNVISSLHRVHEGPVWQMDAARISGDVLLKNCTFEGDAGHAAFSGNRLHVEGSLLLDACHVLSLARPGEEGRATEFRLNEAVIVGNMQLGRTTADPGFGYADPTGKVNRFESELVACGVAVSGSLNIAMSVFLRDAVFAGSSFRHIQLAAAHFAADLNLFGITCTGIFRVPQWRMPTDAAFTAWQDGGIVIEGSLELSGTRISSQIDFGGLTCRGMINLIGGEIGSFLIASRRFDRSEIGGLSIVDTTFRSYVIVGLASFGPAPSETGATLSIKSSTFANGLGFWSGERRVDVGVSARETTGWTLPGSGQWSDYPRCQVTGEVEISDCRITGDMDLTGIRVSPGPSGQAAGINLTRTHLTGHLRFRSPQSDFEDLAVPTGQREAARRFLALDDEDGAQAVRARAGFLDLSGVEAGHVDLSGLTLDEPPTEPAGRDDRRDPRAGHVYARDIVVAQDFRLFQTAVIGNAAAPACASTMIPKSLRLDGARIDTLVISADSFDDHESTDPEQDGITFNGAQIGTLHVPRREGLARNGFPVPVQLTGLSVHSWDFGTFGESRSLSPALQVRLANAHLDFMDNDVGLNRDVYRSIQRSLRNRGHDKAAIAIHVAEHYRAQWEPRGKWRPGEARKRVWFGRGRAPLADNVRGLGRSARAALRQLARPNPLRLPYDLFVRKYLHYGASVLPLGWLIVVLFVGSWQLIAHVPQNLKLSEDAARLILADKGSTGTLGALTADIRYRRTADVPPRFIPCSDWSQGDAAWTALRYHLPVVSMFARDEFAPAGSEPLVVAAPAWLRAALPETAPAPARGAAADPCTAAPAADPQARIVIAALPFLSAEDWFQFMALANWIMWPLLLTFLVRRIVRD